MCFREFEVERCVQCVIPGGFPEQQQLLNDSIYRAEELGRPRAFRSRNSGRQMIDWDRSTGSEEALPVMHFFVYFLRSNQADLSTEFPEFGEIRRTDQTSSRFADVVSSVWRKEAAR